MITARQRARSRQVVFIAGPDLTASFAAFDRDLLQRAVRCREVSTGRGAAARLRFAWHLHRAMGAGRPTGLVVMWFAAAGYGAIAAAVCRGHGVPLLVMAGGADVANRPDVEFGDARVPWRRRLVRYVLQSATLVWAFSEPAAHEIAAIAPSAAVVLVPPAVDTDFYHPAPGPRERLVLTACATLTRTTVRQKGVDRLVDAARFRPDVAVAVVGASDESDAWVREWRLAAPPNVTFLGFVTREALRDLYTRAQVYAQLSFHEGFGVAVAEACGVGCVPLITPLPSLLAIAGESAEVVPEDADPHGVAAAIDRALARRSDPQRSVDVARRFGPAVRRAAWGGVLHRFDCLDAGVPLK